MNFPLQPMYDTNQQLVEIQETLNTLTKIICNQTNENRLLSIKEVSHAIGFKADWIYKRMAEKKFPRPTKIKNRNRWSKIVIDEWIDKHCH